MIIIFLCTVLLTIGSSGSPAMISADLIGAIHTITFSENVNRGYPNTGCETLILSESLPHLGTGALCTFPTSNTLQISYGSDTLAGQPTITLFEYGFSPILTGGLSFVRPELPSFTLEMSVEDGYQDVEATLQLGNIQTNNKVGFEYTWTYVASPAGQTLSYKGPEIFRQFKFWEMTPGSYQVLVRMTDPDNTVFYYEESTTFTVRESCSSSCDRITWRMQNNPGTCNSGCVTGHDPSLDTLDYVTSGNTSPFTITAIYQKGSKGGNNLSILPDKYLGLHSSSCGSQIRFPLIYKDSTPLAACQSSVNELTLTSTLDPNGLSLTTDYTTEWKEPTTTPPTTSCNENSASCIIPEGGLPILQGPYNYLLQLNLICLGENAWWTEIAFNAFDYSPTFTTNTLGSIQTLTFTPAVTLSGGSTCEELFTTESVALLGEGAVCQMEGGGSVLTIYYGANNINIQGGGDTLALSDTGFTHCMAGSFLPSQPTFTLLAPVHGLSLYQDTSATFTADNIVNIGNAPLVFQWKYLLSPELSTKPDLTPVTEDKFTFNYWEMTPGEYKIEIKLTDPANSHFIQIEESQFTILESCSAVCETITWTMSNNPGSCASDCVSGGSIGDELEYTTEGVSPPYKITASYKGSSRGGQSLSIRPEKYNNLHSVECGENLMFPDLRMGDDTSPSHMDSEPLELSGRLIGASSLMDYSTQWVQPLGVDAQSYCVDGELSCTIPAYGLNIGGPYIFKLQLKLGCQGEGDVWDELLFASFQYMQDVQISVQGSIQTITFPNDVMPSAGDSCKELLLDATYLGIGSQCSLLNNILTIKYGAITVIGEVTLYLAAGGFNPPIFRSFLRPDLPHFTLSEQGERGSAYQDNIHIFILSDIVGDPMEYTWSYLQSPDGSTKPDLGSVTGTSVTFNYWEMSVGDYEISIKMRDVSPNALYSYKKDSGIFRVLESCSTNNCDEIYWKFTNNPGVCSEDCVTGARVGDSFEFSTTGSGSEHTESPFTVTVRYLPESKGGNNLNLVSAKYQGLHSFPCGANLKFPHLDIVQNTQTTQPSDSPITLEADLSTNDLLINTHFTKSWVQTEEDYCADNSNICIIPTEGLEIGGGPFAFKLQLTLVCQGGSGSGSPSWSEAAFQTFYYTPAISISTTGSIQRITFAKALSIINGDSCAELLTPESLGYMGVGYECSLVMNNMTLELKYGFGADINGTQVMRLNPDGFDIFIGNMPIPMPALPNFVLSSTGVDAPTYQDNSATFTAADLVNIGNAPLKFVWSYILSPEDNIVKPDIREYIGSVAIFNYWQLGPGTYQVSLRVTDPANTIYYYEENSPSFTVLESCSVTTSAIIWYLKDDPGSCASDCITGSAPGDSFTFITTGSSSPYTITATYLVGSQGGRSISIRPEKYNNLNSAQCGEQLKFQTLSMREDSPEIHNSELDLTLSGRISDENLILGTDYREIWKQPAGFSCCVDGTSICTIPHSLLNDGTGPYSFKLQIKLMDSEIIWSEVLFSPFYVSSTIAVSTFGSVQTITFTVPVIPVNGETCAELLSSASLSHLGLGYECSLLNNIMQIKYGENTTPGPQTISLLSSGFDPNTPGSFSRPELPQFTMSVTGHEFPAYQDNVVHIFARDIINIGEAPLIYIWTYISSPIGGILKSDLSSETSSTFNFNYWELSAGNYQINLKMTDPDNSHFSYAEDSPVFTVIESCSAACDTIIWTFTNYPKACSTNCFTNIGPQDTFIAVTTGNITPYTLTAIYQPGSRGGHDISPNPLKYGGLTNIPCGANLLFPILNITTNDAPDCQYSGSDLYLEGTLMATGLILDVDYTQSWITPERANCEPGYMSCIIPKGSLAVGGPYEFILRVNIACRASTAWGEVIFNPFYYTPVLTPSTLGSIQTITFSDDIDIDNLDIECSGVIAPESLNYLGSNPLCEITSPTTLQIKYGADIIPGEQIIYLQKAGTMTSSCNLGTFTRAILPRFTLQTIGAVTPAYQDHSVTFTADSIINPNQVPILYEWTYNTYVGNIKPDISGMTSSSYTFNYWEMEGGEYIISMKMRDPENSQYSYEQLSPKLIILSSCSTTCNSVSWLFENNPGECLNNDCVTGHLDTGDKLVLGTSGISIPYIITARYEKGSKGGNNLQIIPEKYKGFHSVGCGSDLQFPNLLMGTNAPEVLSPFISLNLSAVLNTQGLLLGSHYTQSWVTPKGFNSICNSKDLFCVIPPQSLETRKDLYLFNFQIKLLCSDVGDVGDVGEVWSELQFRPFIYTSQPRANIKGGSQSYNNTDNIILSAENSLNMNEPTINPPQNLSFMWECIIGIVGPIDTGCKTMNGEELLPSTNMIYEISPLTLLPGIYHFKLTITESFGGITDEANTLITIITSESKEPLVNMKHNWIIYQIINQDIDNSFEIALKEGIHHNSANMKYEWKIDPAISTLIISDRFLTIPKGALEANTEYVLSCRITTKDGDNTIVFNTFRSATEIVSGMLTSDILDGFGFDTEFTFTANNFSPGEGEKLEYMFFAQTQGINLLIPLSTNYQYKNTLTTQLPLGEEDNEYKLLVIVRAKNKLNMVKSLNTTVIVKPSEGGYTQEFVKNLLSSEQAQSTNILDKIQILGRLSSLSIQGRNTNKASELGLCGKCNLEFGLCDTNTEKCKCKEGYSGPQCSLTAQQAEINRNIQLEIATSIQNVLSSNNNMEKEHILTMLRSSSIGSEGIYLGDSEGNQIYERIQEIFVDKLKNGEFEGWEAVTALLHMISNLMEGVQLEKDYLTVTEDNSESFENRLKLLFTNIKLVAKSALQEIPVGISIPPLLEHSFHLLGGVYLNKFLGDISIQSPDGPKVTFGEAVESEVESQDISLIYIDLKSHIHKISSTSEPLTNILDLVLTDLQTEKDITTLQNSIQMVFQLIMEKESPKCVFYDLEKVEYSLVGMETIVDSETSNIICTSTHLSEFTVVSFPGEESNSDSDNYTTEIIICVIVASIIIMIIVIISIFYIKSNKVHFIHLLFTTIYRQPKSRFNQKKK